MSKLSVSIPANLKIPGRKPRPVDADADASMLDPGATGQDAALDEAQAQRTRPPTPLLLVLGLVLAIVVLVLVRGRGEGSPTAPPA